MSTNELKEKKTKTPKSSASSKTKTPKKQEALKPLKNTVELPSAVFGIEINNQAMFDTVMMERASRRQGTHSVKSRAEVSGTGKKPWKQKGTGRARQGSLRSPQFVGGGRAFGPRVERNYNLKVNKKVRRLAFLSALSLLAKEGSILVDDSIKLKEPKKQGYTFLCWKDSEENEYTKITEGSTGDISLKAYWKPNENTAYKEEIYLQEIEEDEENEEYSGGFGSADYYEDCEDDEDFDDSDYEDIDDDEEY